MKFYVSPRIEISQLSEQLVQCFTTLIVNVFFPYQVRISCIPSCVRCLTFFYSTLLTSVFSVSSHQGTANSNNIFPDSPIFKTEQTLFSQLVLLCHKLQPPNHLNAPLLDFLQSIHALLVPRSPRTDTVRDDVS